MDRGQRVRRSSVFGCSLLGGIAVGLILGLQLAPAEQSVPFRTPGSQWQAWSNEQKLFYLKGFVEGFDAAGAPIDPPSAVRTIGDLRLRVDQFFAEDPRLGRVGVPTLLNALFQSTVDLKALIEAASEATVREEEVVDPSPGVQEITPIP